MQAARWDRAQARGHVQDSNERRERARVSYDFSRESTEEPTHEQLLAAWDMLKKGQNQVESEFNEGEDYHDDNADNREIPITNPILEAYESESEDEMGNMNYFMLYNTHRGDELRAPKLLSGDRKSRLTFAEAYLKYWRSHKAQQRKRPRRQRVPAKAVIECMDADLLELIVTEELPVDQRKQDVAEASAKDVHRWVMMIGKERPAHLVEQGITALKNLKCEISGADAVKNVMKFYIEIKRCIRKFRIDMKTSAVTKILTWGISPPNMKRRVRAALDNGTATDRAAAKLLPLYYRVLKSLAQKAVEAHELGFSSKKPATGNNTRKPKHENGNTSNKNKKMGILRTKIRAARSPAYFVGVNTPYDYVRKCPKTASSGSEKTQAETA